MTQPTPESAPAPGMDSADRSLRPLIPFAALSGAYFAHIGFFNPYLTLWLKDLGLPLVVISLVVAAQPFTRVFAPYIWGLISDRTGHRVRLLRFSAVAAAVVSLGLFVEGGAAWLAAVLFVLFVLTSSMMGLTEAAMAHVVAGDWGRYGRVRLWGSAGFLVTVFLAGAWFERFGMHHFPGWAVATLVGVAACTFWLPKFHDQPTAGARSHAPIAPVLRQPVVVWFFVLRWRGHERFQTLHWLAYDGAQLLLVALTAATVGILLFAVSAGLLGNPKMFILGNGSTSTLLRWFQARSEGPTLPVCAGFSVSIWWYRFAMLLWALWLAVSALGWLSAAWKSFASGGFFRRRPQRTPPATSSVPAPPLIAPKPPVPPTPSDASGV